MHKWLAIFLIAVVAYAEAHAGEKSIPVTKVLCSDSWYQFVEEHMPTGDGQGHGPDPGSGEWKSVIEFKLGLRGKPNIPKRDSEAWCRHIDQIIECNR